MQLRYFTTINYLISLLVLSALVSAGLAQAQDLSAQLNVNGKQVKITIPPGYSGPRKARFYAVSKGNISSRGSFYLTAPGRVSATIDARQFLGSVKQALRSKKGSYSVDLDINRFRIPAAESSSLQVAAVSGLPKNCTPEMIQILRRTLESIPIIGELFKNMSDKELCEYVLNGEESLPIPIPTIPGGGGIPDPGGVGAGRTTGEAPPAGPEANGWVRSGGSLLKDTCNRRSGLKYLVVMDVDLSAVDQALFDRGFEIAAYMNIREYRGKMAASIKPVSDGKYAPQPLLLMSALPRYCFSPACGTYQRLVQWSGGKPQRMSNITMDPGPTFYRGLLLTRSVITKYLSGGVGVFELDNGSEQYGVCMRLVRTRQCVNGYPVCN